jgi:hypothetical protein
MLFILRVQLFHSADRGNEGVRLLLSQGGTVQHREILLPITWGIDEGFGCFTFCEDPSHS